MIRRSKSWMTWSLVHPGRHFEGPLRRMWRPHVEVQVALRRRLPRAQRLLVPGQRHARAVGELRDPPVHELAVVIDEVEPSVRHLMPAQVAEHREQEAGEQQRRPPREAAPGPDDSRQVEHGREHHDQIGFPDDRGRGEQQPGHGGRRLADRAVFPYQHDQRRHEQERRADIGEDVLLDVELERVEQDRDGRQRGQPAPGAEVDQNRVDQHGRGQPEQMLHHGDHREVAGQHRRDEQQRVAAGAQPVRRPVAVNKVPGVHEVPLAVREDQRRLVGQLHHGAQRGGASRHDREQPVPAQAAPGSAGRTGVRSVGTRRAPTWRSACST